MVVVEVDSIFWETILLWDFHHTLVFISLSDTWKDQDDTLTDCHERDHHVDTDITIPDHCHGAATASKKSLEREFQDDHTDIRDTHVNVAEDPVPDRHSDRVRSFVFVTHVLLMTITCPEGDIPSSKLMIAPVVTSTDQVSHLIQEINLEDPVGSIAEYRKKAITKIININIILLNSVRI